jgi:hypothetical protein
MILSSEDVPFVLDRWLWCSGCERFFQGGNARPSYRGRLDGCAFCSKSGWGDWILPWDAGATTDGRWPAMSELRRGLRSPPYRERDRDPVAARLARCRTLDRNHRRRNEILGIETSDDPGVTTPFARLDLARLQQLVDERFIHPEERHGRAPCTMDIQARMRRWPELQAHGFAVHPSRDDYRVAIEGYELVTDGVSADRVSEIFFEFVDLDCEADECEYDMDGVIYTRWLEPTPTGTTAP